MKNEFKSLEDGSVLSFDACMLRIDKLLSSIWPIFASQTWNLLRKNLNEEGVGLIPEFRNNDFFGGEGVEYEVLKPGENWQKGKVRMKVIIEFCPDEPEIEESSIITEPESSLDELRRQINGVTSS